MDKRIPVPLALNELINYTNQEIERLRNVVANASVEQLQILGLTMEDGWRLDYEARQFVNITAPSEEAPAEQ
jgi:hypothetical protein